MAMSSPATSPRRNDPRRWSSPYLLAVVPLLVSALLLLLISRDHSSLVHPSLRRSRSVLWVTAHPDDESLFFVPSIVGLLNGHATGHLLCLSVGDHEGLGGIRAKELKASCRTLGIAEHDCVALDIPELRDDPVAWWDGDLVEEIVREYVHKWSIDLIITFDSYGVSGHANHRAISSSLTNASLSSTPFPQTVMIHSTNLLSKFSSLLSLPPTLLTSYFFPHSSASVFISDMTGYQKARESFGAHESQSRWYRSLFVLFSRYLWVVELRDPCIAE